MIPNRKGTSWQLTGRRRRRGRGRGRGLGRERAEVLEGGHGSEVARLLD